MSKHDHIINLEDVIHIHGEVKHDHSYIKYFFSAFLFLIFVAALCGVAYLNQQTNASKNGTVSGAFIKLK